MNVFHDYDMMNYDQFHEFPKCELAMSLLVFSCQFIVELLKLSSMSAKCEQRLLMSMVFDLSAIGVC